MGDWATNTEHDAAISAGFDCYDDRGLDRPTRADLEAEAEWYRAFPDREPTGELLAAFDRAVAAVADADPGTCWGPDAHDRLMAVLTDVLCGMCRRNEAEANGLCRWCLDELRDEDYSE